MKELEMLKIWKGDLRWHCYWMGACLQVWSASFKLRQAINACAVALRSCIIIEAKNLHKQWKGRVLPCVWIQVSAVARDGKAGSSTICLRLFKRKWERRNEREMVKVISIEGRKRFEKSLHVYEITLLSLLF